MEALRKLGMFGLNLMERLRSEKGQTIIEYILVIVLVSLVLILILTGGGLESGVQAGVDQITDKLGGAVNSP